MLIHTVHIISFGGLENREFPLEQGVNVIAGNAGSGRSTVAAFVKFVFYGLGREPDRNGMTELRRYLPRESGKAAGWIAAETSDGERWRLERAVVRTKEGTLRELCRIIRLSPSEAIVGKNPGEYFFGVSEMKFRIAATAAGPQEMPPEPSTGEYASLKRVRKTLLASEEERNRQEDASSLEASLSDIERRIAELEADRERNADTAEALDVFAMCEKIDSMTEKRRALSA